MKAKEKINVFGKEITIHTEGYIKTVHKKTDEVVILRAENQFAFVLEIPLYMKDYGVTAEEFIEEFNKQNIEVYMKKIKNNVNE